MPYASPPVLLMRPGIIEILRVGSGRTVLELATSAGVNRARWYQYERAKALRQDRVRVIARALGSPMRHLVEP